MSEELRDELAQIAMMWRPKFQGFGRFEAAYAGAVANGVRRRQIIKYIGSGFFNVAGITTCSINLTTWARSFPARNSYSFTLMLADQTPIITDCLSGSTGINGLYDNLDSGIVLGQNDFLIYESCAFSTTAQQYCGFIYGDEYVI